MTREEVEGARDDMLIDGCEPEERQGNAVPEGFSTNYLKIYYGIFSLSLFSVGLILYLMFVFV